MSDLYPLKPTDAELNDESLFSVHTGEMGCRKCEVVGAHQWATGCVCCGKQQSRFDSPSEWDGYGSHEWQGDPAYD